MGNVRLTVNISPDTQAALQRVVKREAVTMTEALRRLIGYGDLLYREVKVAGNDVLVRHGDETRAVILL